MISRATFPRASSTFIASLLLLLSSSLPALSSSFVASTTNAFVTTTRTGRRPSTTTTRLWAGKKSALRRELVDLNNDDNDDGTSKRNKRRKKEKRTTTKTTKSERTYAKNGGGGGGKGKGSVSAALAEWAASSSSSTTTTTTTAASSSINDEDDDEEGIDLAYSSFDFDDSSSSSSGKKKKPSSVRRQRQSGRRAAESTNRSEIRRVATELIELAEEEKDRNVDGMLERIRTLVKNCLPPDSADASVAVSSVLKRICGGTNRKNYRMVWAGSDEAITALGTGLHNVPLARLQEVFITVGRNRMEMYEVISILGPFPNVKNVLRGDVSSSRSPNTGRPLLNIVFDSMVDGTGKEILAGKEENVRNVDLETVFSSEDVIVCRSPSNDDDDDERSWDDGDGSDLLIFVYEDDMDSKMESLRVL